MSVHPDLVGLIFTTNEQGVQKLDVSSTAPLVTISGHPKSKDVPTIETPSDEWGGLPFDPEASNLTEAQRKLRDDLAFERFLVEHKDELRKPRSEESIRAEKEWERQELERQQQEQERARRGRHWWKSHLAMNSF